MKKKKGWTQPEKRRKIKGLTQKRIIWEIREKDKNQKKGNFGGGNFCSK